MTNLSSLHFEVF